MCGIIGYIGINAITVIKNGLLAMEYRGYDSCGVAYYAKELEIIKNVGSPQLLKSILPNVESNLAIGHTRWATHGKPSLENAHPLQSEDMRFTIIHNGVIDNYQELKKQYLKKTMFKSETDTEVIVNLLSYFAKKNQDVLTAIKETIKLLKGSYALLIIDSNNADVLYIAKYGSPLLIGTGVDAVCVTSDSLAFPEIIKKYAILEDGMIGVISKELIDIRQNNEKVNLKFNDNDAIYKHPSLGNYKHFMLKEIFEQQNAIYKIFKTYVKRDKKRFNDKIHKLILKAKEINIIAAGSSYHAGLLGKRYFEHFLNKKTNVYLGSEFAYNQNIINKKALFIVISQSGETADLIKCLKLINQPTIAITNVVTSTIAKNCLYTIKMEVGPEIAVASTKAYFASVFILFLLATINIDYPFLAKEIIEFYHATEKVLKMKVSSIKDAILIQKKCFFIGRGWDYDVALEAALKLKEIAYIQTEGFPSGELKHGSLALIEEDVVIIAFITQTHTAHQVRSNIEEAKSRGAKVFVIAKEDVAENEDSIILPAIMPHLEPLLLVIIAQFIAYYSAIEQGFNCDKPRNLAKSVTVE